MIVQVHLAWFTLKRICHKKEYIGQHELLILEFCYVNSYSSNGWNETASIEQKNCWNFKNCAVRERVPFLHCPQQLYRRNRDELRWLRKENPSRACSFNKLSSSKRRLPKMDRRHALRHRVSQKNKPDRVNASSWRLAKGTAGNRADKDNCAQNGTSSPSEAHPLVVPTQILIQNCTWTQKSKG